jgi:hypothetical protein
MKLRDNLIIAIWFLITIALAIGVTYQSWKWFLEYRYPVGLVMVQHDIKEYMPLPEFKTFDYAVQRTGNPQSAVPAEFIQIDRIGLPFSGKVCDPAKLDAISEYEAILIAKPHLRGSGSEMEVRLERLRADACK